MKDSHNQGSEKKPLEWCGEVVPCYRCSGGWNNVTKTKCTACLGSGLS